MPAQTPGAATMSAMVDMRRRGPEPPETGPEIEFKPGMAREMLRELAPLLAEEGIHVDEHGELSNVFDDGAVPDLGTLQRALDRAVERQNLALFTPTGRARELAATALHQVTEAIADGDTARAAAVLEQVQPESPDHTAATVAGCTGVALGLLDEWLPGRDPNAPTDLAAHTRLPPGHWFGERAATDVLVLAAKGRAFRSLHTLTIRQGGHHLLYASALALAAACLAWARQTGTELAELTATIIR
jgi:hypothetical protein